MNTKLRTTFSKRQYMLSEDFELYYYHDSRLSRVDSHAHDYYEFYFFLEGDVSLFIEGTPHRLRTGDVILLPPGVQHYVTVQDAGIAYRRFVFWISKAYWQRLLSVSKDYGYLLQQLPNKRYIFHYDFIGFHALQAKIFSLLEEIHADRFGKAAKIPLCVEELILHLNRSAYEADHPALPGEKQPLYQNLLQYIEWHIDEDLSLDRLARAFYVNKYHIAHVFRENLGLSVHQYITKKRLALCRDALCRDSNLGDICLLYGFSDYSTFYRAFKKEYGISPGRYKDSLPDRKT